MPTDPLPPDPNSLDEWQHMPQNRPSRDAHAPAMGGTRWAIGLLIIMGALLILALLFQGQPT